MSTAKPPRVSVALATYNGAKFLQPQLDSLSAQDYPELEIVAVDDASTDDSWPLLETHARRDRRFRVTRNESNLGMARNLEHVLSLCTGDLLACADHDDVWSTTHVSELVAALEEHTLVYCDSRLVDAEGRELGRLSDTRTMIQGSRPLAFVFFNCVSAHAMLFRRELLEVARPFPTHAYHDWWLAYCASVVGSIGYLDRCLVDYRHHDAMTTRVRRRDEPQRPGYRQRLYRHQVEWLERLAAVPGAPPQVGRLATLLKRWDGELFAWALAVEILASRGELFAIPELGVGQQLARSLKWLAGGRLRRTLLPRRWGQGSRSRL